MSYAAPKRAYPGSRRNGSWKGRTTAIRVTNAIGDVLWNVPRGFGAAYQRCIQAWAGDQQGSAEVLRDILGLVGYEVTVEAVLAWPLRKRVDAEVYAASVHLRASDNPVQVPPRPEWMPEPWKGPDQGEGVFAGPSGTVLT